MTRIKTTIVAFVLGATILSAFPSEVSADGPLRRWWRGLKTRKCCASSPASCSTCPSPVAATTPNAYDLKPGQCMKTCQQTCTRTVVNYVPYTAYRTCYKKVPVTTYKPVTTSDPCTGCTVTCMKPCTTYTNQCERVPYTTYRPVYRQETYKVPVTTITNDCSTGTCASNTCGPVSAPAAPGCSTCGPGQGPVVAPQQNFAPQALPTPAPVTSTYYENAPSGSLSTGGSYNSTVPANTAPSLLNGVSSPQASQRPLTDRFGNPTSTQGNSSYQTSSPRPVQEPWPSAPATINMEDKTAQSPVRKQWSYSPVRLASYEKPAVARSVAPRPTVQPQLSRPMVRQRGNDLNGWVEVN